MSADLWKQEVVILCCLTWLRVNASGTSSSRRQTRRVCTSCQERGSAMSAANAIATGRQAATWSTPPYATGRLRAEVSTATVWPAGLLSSWYRDTPVMGLWLFPWLQMCPWPGCLMEEKRKPRTMMMTLWRRREDSRTTRKMRLEGERGPNGITSRAAWFVWNCISSHLVCVFRSQGGLKPTPTPTCALTPTPRRKSPLPHAHVSRHVPHLHTWNPSLNNPPRVNKSSVIPGRQTQE